MPGPPARRSILEGNHPPVRPAHGRILMNSRKYDRRSVLAYSAMGGAALAGALFGAVNETVVEGQGATAALPLPAGRMRRVVTGHNAGGKSYIVSDELADPANLWA